MFHDVNQIMDPKMDSGMVRTYYSVDEAIEYGAAPIPLSLDKTVDVQRIIDIMDHLLACEVLLASYIKWIISRARSFFLG